MRTEIIRLKSSRYCMLPLLAILFLSIRLRTSFGGSVASCARTPVSLRISLVSTPSTLLFTFALPSLNHMLCATSPFSVVRPIEKLIQPSLDLRYSWFFFTFVNSKAKK